MEKITINIDLTNKITKEEVIECFTMSLGLPKYLRDNWDAFDDIINSLHSESTVVIEKKPKAVHLILKNIHHFEQNSPEEYKTLIELLAEATDKKQRYDGIDFTFEIANDIEK